MGEKQTKPFQLSFNGLLKVDFQGSHVTSDGGLILVRELDERRINSFRLQKVSRGAVSAGAPSIRQAARLAGATSRPAKRFQCALSPAQVLDHGSPNGPLYPRLRFCQIGPRRHPLLLFNQHGDCLAAKLRVLSYNLGNLWRRLGLPRRIKSWSLTSLQQRLMKTGGRLVKHARYYWLLLAEGHLNRKLFGQMLGRLAALPVPGG